MPELDWLPGDRGWNNTVKTGGDTLTWPGLVALANRRIDFLQTARLDKLLNKFDAAPPTGLPTNAVRLAVYSSYTNDHLLPGLRVGALRRNIWLRTHVSAYGQYLNEILDPTPALEIFAPTAGLFAFDNQHLLGAVPNEIDLATAKKLITGTIDRVRNAWKLARGKFGGDLIQQTLLPIFPALMGSNERRLPGSLAELTEDLNAALRVAADQDGVDILALDAQSRLHGLSAWHDVRLWLRAKQYLSPIASPLYGDLVARLLAARQGRSAKCLVLDLDNTLWGGVIGDDGLSGLVLGQGHAVGEAFIAFQHYVKKLSQRGVILAVCSKNDEANALAPFTSHPEMVLKQKDFACFVANWDDKAANIRRIAERLNIGIDSLVFVDDSPFERELVRRELPMVAVPELPDDPAFFATCIANAGYFEAVTLTREDRERTHQYQASAQREAARSAHTDIASYLKSLDMALEWSRFDEVNLQRVIQLINKTNQFNLTTRRYDETHVRKFMQDPRALLLHFRLRDKFGDNGIIAAVMGHLNENTRDIFIDSWLMSCRVLGRKVEEATLNILVGEATRMGAKRLIGEFVPTARNDIVRDHYRKLGFSAMKNEKIEASRWMLEIPSFTSREVPMVTARIQA